MAHPAGPIDISEPLPGAGFGDLVPIHQKMLPLDKKFDPESVIQQRLTNCPLPALLSAMANARPKMIKSMIDVAKHGTPKNVWYAKRYLPLTRYPYTCESTIKVKFQRKTIEISPFIYTTNSNGEDPKVRFTKCNDGSGWASYIEKAYVVYRADHEYSKLDLLAEANPLTVERIVEDVAHDFDKLDLADHKFYQDMEPVNQDPPSGIVEHAWTAKSVKSDLSENSTKNKVKSMLANAKKRPTIFTNDIHTKAVLSYSNGTVTTYDPMMNNKSDVKLDDFITEAFSIIQVK